MRIRWVFDWYAWTLVWYASDTQLIRMIPTLVSDAYQMSIRSDPYFWPVCFIMFYRWFNNIYDSFFIPVPIFILKILLIFMILCWDRCAKLPPGGGHHRKADDIQSLRVEGCQLDCRWFDTPFLRAPCLRSRYLGAPCCVCVARADYDGGRSVNNFRLCIWIQWGRTKWVMRCSFRMTR
jgi:hypothetical protein